MIDLRLLHPTRKRAGAHPEIAGNLSYVPELHCKPNGISPLHAPSKPTEIPQPKLFVIRASFVLPEGMRLIRTEQLQQRGALFALFVVYAVTPIVEA